MGRKKAANPKNSRIDLRTYPDVKAHLDRLALKDHRTLSDYVELLIRKRLAEILDDEGEDHDLLDRR